MKPTHLFFYYLKNIDKASELQNSIKSRGILFCNSNQGNQDIKANEKAVSCKFYKHYTDDIKWDKDNVKCFRLLGDVFILFYFKQ